MATLEGKLASSHPALRMGIAYLDCGRLDTRALTYLLLCQNDLQRVFEYNVEDLRDYAGRWRRPAPGQRDSYVIERARKAIEKAADDAAPWSPGVRIDFPDKWLIVTGKPLDNNTYDIRDGNTAVLSFANWKKWMAPPSALEFVLRYCQRQSLDFLRKDPRSHYMTKGCLYDFNQDVGTARNMVLIGTLCPSCETRIHAEVGEDVMEAFSRLLDRKWLGSLNVPESVASVLKKAFNYDLYTTKTLAPGPLEIVKNTFLTSGTTQMVALLVAVLLSFQAGRSTTPAAGVGGFVNSLTSLLTFAVALFTLWLLFRVAQRFARP